MLVQEEEEEESVVASRAWICVFAFSVVHSLVAAAVAARL